MTTIDHAAEALDHIHSANIAAGPWEPVEGDTPARHARDSGA